MQNFAFKLVSSFLTHLSLFRRNSVCSCNERSTSDHCIHCISYPQCHFWCVYQQQTLIFLHCRYTWFNFDLYWRIACFITINCDKMHLKLGEEVVKSVSSSMQCAMVQILYFVMDKFCKETTVIVRFLFTKSPQLLSKSQFLLLGASVPVMYTWKTIW